MRPLLLWLTAPGWEQVVKALLHSLWQAGALAGVLALALRWCANPAWRYRFALGSLATVLFSVLVTWAVLNLGRNDAVNPSHNPSLPVESNRNKAFSSRTGETIILNAEPRRQPAAAETVNWTGWLALLWVAGAALMLVRAGFQVAGAERLRRNSRPLTDDRITQLLNETQRAIGFVRRVRLTVTDALISPAVVGVLVPTLILPLSLVTTLTHEQLRFVLLHELAHIRRGDYFVNLLQLLIEALFFFNPAVWWVSHQVRREREACCDARAIALSDAPAEYARTLVQVAEQSLAPTAAATAFGNEPGKHSALVDRVQRLLVPGYRPALRCTWRATLISFVLGGALLVLSALGTRTTVGAILADAKAAATPTKTAKPSDVAPARFGWPSRWIEPNTVSETVEWTHPRFAPKRRDSGYGYVISDYNSLSLVGSNRTRIPLLDDTELTNTPSIDPATWAIRRKNDAYEVTISQYKAFIAAIATNNYSRSLVTSNRLRIPLLEDGTNPVSSPPPPAPVNGHSRTNQNRARSDFNSAPHSEIPIRIESANSRPSWVGNSIFGNVEVPIIGYRIGTYEVPVDKYVAFLAKAEVPKSDYSPSLATSNLLRIPLHDDTENTNAPAIDPSVWASPSINRASGKAYNGPTN